MRFFRKLAGAIGALFRKKRAETELDEELRSYLDQAASDHRHRGMTRDDAMRAARVEMGSLEAVKDEVRSAGWEAHFESLWQDLRYSLRMLRKNAALTLVVIFTLALGIGANTAVFSLIDAVALRRLPVRSPQELVSIRMRRLPQGIVTSSFTNPMWEQLRDRQDVFANTFAWSNADFDLSQGGPVDRGHGLWVNGGFFAGLGLQPAAGRLIAAADDQRGCPGAVVLSHEFWEDRFGRDPRAIGSSIMLDNRPFPIVGVAPAGFYGITVGTRFDVALPICAQSVFDNKILDARSHWWLNVAARVRPEMPESQIRSRLAVISPTIFSSVIPDAWDPEGKKNFPKWVFVESPAASGVSRVTEFETPLKVLMAIAGAVLLIACANIASLMLARSAARRKEIAVRQALGASRPRLVRQLLAESMLLSICGAAAGILLARWAGTALVAYISTRNEPVFLDLSLDHRVLAFTAIVAVLTGVLFGVLPAFRSTRISTAAAMKGGAPLEGDRRFRFRAGKLIVASQVALSLVLLIAAGLFLRSFVKLTSMDFGFDRQNVVLASVDLKATKLAPERRSAALDDIEGRIRAVPGVLSAGRSWTTPISGIEWNQYVASDAPDAPQGEDRLVFFNFISPGYLDTLRMPLLAGRNFNEHDTTTGPRVAIINQTMARRFYKGLDPVGRMFQINPEPGKPAPEVQVVGVVKDSKYESAREDTFVTAFFPISQIPGSARTAEFEIRTAASLPAISPSIQAAIAGVDKSISIEFHTLESQVGDSLVRDRLLAMLSGFFGGLALLLAMIGLYGTFSYLVTQRQKEFGVRVALGARLKSIAGLVMRDTAVVLAGGIIAGVVLAVMSTGALETLLFELGARDALTIALAVVLLSAASFLAAYLPARRAARVDPMIALREE